MYIVNTEVHFVGSLCIMELINARKVELVLFVKRLLSLHVKRQSCYRLGGAQRVPGSLMSHHTAL